MKIAIEVAKLTAIVAVFAITVPLMYLGRWLLLCAFYGVQMAGRIVGWRQ